MNIFGVVMAGGGGTRFWPLSRVNKPKQLLNLTGKDVIINETIDRLSYIVSSDNLFVVTSASHSDKLKEITAQRIKSKNVIVEPEGRNTCACIAYAAEKIIRTRGDGIVIFVPSDHSIKDLSSYTRSLSCAVTTAAENDCIVTIGITPTFASTGYGYIKCNKDSLSKCALDVAEFKEKPDKETAERYLESGQYYWNSGMFVCRAGKIIELVEKYSNDIYCQIKEIGNSIGLGNEETVVKTVYPKIRKVSIDYAVIENAASDGKVMTVPGDFGWCDVGSWDMMDSVNIHDTQGNICTGDTLVYDTTNSIVYSSGRIVAVLGADNLVVVETPDAVMVCPKNRAQDVGKIVAMLKEKGRGELT